MKKANEFYADNNKAYDLTSSTDIFRLAEDYAEYCNRNKTGWISVKDQHFVDIKKYDNSYTWESDEIGSIFMVAVPTNKGWDIEKVVLTDVIGLECYSDGETSCFEWEMIDVTNWYKITPPKE